MCHEASQTIMQHGGSAYNGATRKMPMNLVPNSDTPPLTPKTIKRLIAGSGNPHQLNQAPVSASSSTNNIKQVLNSAPCPCTGNEVNYENIDMSEASTSTKFVGPYKNYDIPRTATKQVRHG